MHDLYHPFGSGHNMPWNILLTSAYSILYCNDWLKDCSDGSTVSTGHYETSSVRNGAKAYGCVLYTVSTDETFIDFP